MRSGMRRSGNVLALTMVFLMVLTALGLLFFRVTREVRQDASLAYHRLHATAAVENALIEAQATFAKRVNQPHVRYERPRGQAPGRPSAATRAAEVTANNDAAFRRFLERNDGPRSLQARAVAAGSGG